MTKEEQFKDLIEHDTTLKSYHALYLLSDSIAGLAQRQLAAEGAIRGIWAKSPASRDVGIRAAQLVFAGALKSGLSLDLSNLSNTELGSLAAELDRPLQQPESVTKLTSEIAWLAQTIVDDEGAHNGNWVWDGASSEVAVRAGSMSFKVLEALGTPLEQVDPDQIMFALEGAPAMNALNFEGMED